MSLKPAPQIGALARLEETKSITPVGMVLPNDITLDEMEALGQALGGAHESLKFAVGDWMRYCEDIFPEEAAQLSESLGLSPAQRMQYIRVSRDVPIDRRLFGLTWSHHRSVAPLEAKDQTYWLQQALEKGLSKQELETAIRAKRDKKAITVKEHTRGHPHVIEQVAKAAEEVYEDAEIQDDGTYMVHFEPMQKLGKALGEEA